MFDLVRMPRLVPAIAMLLCALPAAAQMRTVDPNTGAATGSASATSAGGFEGEPVDPGDQGTGPGSSRTTSGRAAEVTRTVATPVGAQRVGAGSAEAQASAASANATYQDGDLIDAAEGVFGKGAEGLAKLIEKILKDQGRPNAYIAGREVGGAIAVGVRYGSGTMFHKVEGQRPVFWTGPSLGFDLGASGAKTFVLVYNLYDTQDLFKRFPAVEGQAYFIGGFNASYLRRGDTVLIPIRLGVGWRLGANVGYMRFSEKSRLLPF